MSMETNTFIEHPGAVFQEKLLELGMSVKEFAIRSGKAEKTVIDIIKGRASITPEMSLLIEYVTGMSADVLLNWQTKYDIQEARARMDKRARSYNEWIIKLPVNEMEANGWIEPCREKSDRVAKVLRFYGVASPEAWMRYYYSKQLRVAFNASLKQAINPYALSAWLRRGEVQADKIILDNVYSPKLLKERLPEIAFLLRTPPDDVLSMLRGILEETGIKLIYTEPLPSVPVNGATRWIAGVPCIQLLNRKESYDDFTHTVFHEIGHILLHGHKDVFIENVGSLCEDPEYLKKEAEADEFARKYLD